MKLSWQQTGRQRGCWDGDPVPLFEFYILINYSETCRGHRREAETQEEEPRVCIVCVGEWAGASFCVSGRGDCRKKGWASAG